MPVPKENILGPLGKGLKVALTVLDFGRTTFGACCTGAAKTSLGLAIQHAGTRRHIEEARPRRETDRLQERIDGQRSHGRKKAMVTLGERIVPLALENAQAFGTLRRDLACHRSPGASDGSD